MLPALSLTPLFPVLFGLLSAGASFAAYRVFKRHDYVLGAFLTLAALLGVSIFIEGFAPSSIAETAGSVGWVLLVMLAAVGVWLIIEPDERP